MNSIPNNAIGQAIKKIISNGVNIEQPMIIDYFISIPSKDAGLMIEKTIQDLGYSTSIEYDTESFEWTCYCTKNMLLDYDQIVLCERQLDDIAKTVNGYIDGFGTFGNI